jgi:hypothetical protein
MYKYDHIFDIDVEKKESRITTGIDKNGLKQCNSLCYSLKVPLENVVADANTNSRFIEICLNENQPMTKKSPKWERWGMRDKWIEIQRYLTEINWITDEHISCVQDMLKENKLSNVVLSKLGQIQMLNILINGIEI